MHTHTQTTWLREQVFEQRAQVKWKEESKGTKNYWKEKLLGSFYFTLYRLNYQASLWVFYSQDYLLWNQLGLLRTYLLI